MMVKLASHHVLLVAFSVPACMSRVASTRAAEALACTGVEKVMQTDKDLAWNNICDADRDEAAELSILQVHTHQGLAEDDADRRLRLGSCSSGYADRLGHAFSACVYRCPQTCDHLDEVVRTYLTRGGYPMAKPVMCRYKASFACYVDSEHIQDCLPMLVAAGRLGLRLPKSLDALNSVCSR